MKIIIAHLFLCGTPFCTGSCCPHRFFAPNASPTAFFVDAGPSFCYNKWAPRTAALSMQRYRSGHNGADSKVCSPLADSSVRNGVTAGFSRGMAPVIICLSCIEILHFSERFARRCWKNLIWRCTQEVVRGSTRNALGLERGAWVRLPPSPPNPSGIFLRVFLYFHGKNPLPFGRKRYADIYHRGRGQRGRQEQPVRCAEGLFGRLGRYRGPRQTDRPARRR